MKLEWTGTVCVGGTAARCKCRIWHTSLLFISLYVCFIVIKNLQVHFCLLLWKLRWEGRILLTFKHLIEVPELDISLPYVATKGKRETDFWNGACTVAELLCKISLSSDCGGSPRYSAQSRVVGIQALVSPFLSAALWWSFSLYCFCWIDKNTFTSRLETCAQPVFICLLPFL